jgi:hypothetical protein
MDYEQVFYVTDDGRNASRPVVIDHRTRVPTRTTSVITSAPPAAPVGTLAPATMQYQYPQTSYYGPAVAPQNWIGYPTQPVYAVPPTVAPANNLATILGGFGDIGTLANCGGRPWRSPKPAHGDHPDRLMAIGAKRRGRCVLLGGGGVVLRAAA